MTSTRLQIINPQSLYPLGRRDAPIDAIMRWPHITTSLDASRTAPIAMGC